MLDQDVQEYGPVSIDSAAFVAALHRHVADDFPLTPCSAYASNGGTFKPVDCGIERAKQMSQETAG
jgi:hypothetical protein